MFCELSVELAAERGSTNGGGATIRTARAEIECRALVTRRLAPLHVGGTTVQQIAVPYHWGSVGLVQGDEVNDLFPLVGDPSVHIPESKVATCDVVRGTRARHLPLDASSPALPRRSRH